MTTEQAATGRTADRGSATRAVLLAAARQVFMLEGYAEAGVTDIVALAGASVGSLYHHFSGKADLYLALFEELHNEYDVRTRKAVRECRVRGVTDPLRLLLAGARGYLDVCIEQRDLARMFARGDGPPGFELLWRQRLSDWVSRNTEFKLMSISCSQSSSPMDSHVFLLPDHALFTRMSTASKCSCTRAKNSAAESLFNTSSSKATAWTEPSVSRKSSSHSF